MVTRINCRTHYEDNNDQYIFTDENGGELRIPRYTTRMNNLGALIDQCRGTLPAARNDDCFIVNETESLIIDVGAGIVRRVVIDLIRATGDRPFSNYHLNTMIVCDIHLAGLTLEQGLIDRITDMLLSRRIIFALANNEFRFENNEDVEEAVERISY